MKKDVIEYKELINIPSGKKIIYLKKIKLFPSILTYVVGFGLTPGLAQQKNSNVNMDFND